MRLVLATANEGKIRELAALLAPLGFEAAPQSRFSIEPIEETGATFAANALLKARHAAARAGLPALADDSGLEVDALGGKPGVQSARFAGPDASDEDNNRLLLRELRGVERSKRTARYRCVLALVRCARDTEPLLCEGSWEGFIGEQAAGSLGFGYDPLFVVAGSQRTAAQLDPGLKNSMSHRGQALRKLVQQLPGWLP